MTRTETVEVRPPAWKLRALLTVIVVVGSNMLASAYKTVQGPLEGALAVKQLQDNPENYVTGTLAAGANVTWWISAAMLVVLVLLWVPAMFKLFRYLNAEKTQS